MSIKKIFKYLLFFILLTFVISNIYFTYDYNSSNYVCRYIEDEQDYQKKLILAENNLTLLLQLALYNDICTKNITEKKKLLIKFEKLKLEQNMSN